MDTAFKHRVQRAFDKAAPHYAAAASLQHVVCDQLAQGLPNALSSPLHLPILDAGCGTGFGQRIFSTRYPERPLLALDIAPAMLQQIPVTPKLLRCQGDLEFLPIATASIALLWSSLSLQWCKLPRALQEAYRVLAPAGNIALATLSTETFLELRNAFSTVDHHFHTLTFLSQAEIEAAAQQAGFLDIRCQTHLETVFYPDLPTLLGAIKTLGANQLGANRRKGLLTPSALKRLTDAYEVLRTPQGLPLSYHVVRVYAHT